MADRAPAATRITVPNANPAIIDFFIVLKFLYLSYSFVISAYQILELLLRAFRIPPLSDVSDSIPLYLSIFINNKGPAFRSGRPADQPEQRFLGNGGMEAKAFVRLPAVQFLTLISIPAEQRVLIPGIKIVSVAPAEIVNGPDCCRLPEIETDPDIVLPARTEKGQRIVVIDGRSQVYFVLRMDFPAAENQLRR